MAPTKRKVIACTATDVRGPTRKSLYRSRADIVPALDPTALRRRLTVALDQLDGDEAVVLTLIAERLALGKRRYGQLDLDRDGRNLRREALEEVLDGLVYATAALLQGER